MTSPRYNNLKAQIEDLEDNLKNMENIGELAAEVGEGLKRPKEYSENLPKPRLQEADLQNYMANIDDELESIHILEEKIRDIESQYPEAASDPAVLHHLLLCSYIFIQIAMLLAH